MDKENTGLKTMVESYENILKRKVNLLPDIDPRALSKVTNNVKGTRSGTATIPSASGTKQTPASSAAESSVGQQRNSSAVSANWKSL